MLFYLDYRFSSSPDAVGVRLFDAADHLFSETNTLHVQKGAQRLETIDTPGGRLLILGDPVFRNRENLGARLHTMPGKLDEAILYDEVPGHYYWFLVQPGGLCCGTSFGAIFPVYLHQKADRVVISSASFLLAETIGANTRDRRNLLERLLFNYPFFNSTWWEEIRLLPAHRYLHISGDKAVIAGNFDIHRHFGTGGQNPKESLAQLVDLFGDECARFVPEAPFGISFTGGFDGRTLVAAARKAGRRDFLTYSFGRPGASDVTFPEAQTRQLGIQYLPILLDQDYVIQHAWESALAFMRLTENNGNFGRPHYHYAARLLSERVEYILTGNFGSEMFRALHQPGVMMTENLIRIFSTKDQSWKDYLTQSSHSIGTTFFREELDALIADLEQYLAPMAAWPANHKFYHFVFNEIFRKYFGPELVMQSHYFNNRTPFLSFRFFCALNNSIWSGVHANLFEKHKNKRLKGQVFYASFLRQADQQMYRQNTSKGYSPADVLETWRLPLLVAKVGLHKYLRKQEWDSNAEDAFLRQFRTSMLERIRQNDDGLLQDAGIMNRLSAAVAKDDFEETIKYGSIAEGWTAARGSLVTG